MDFGRLECLLLLMPVVGEYVDFGRLMSNSYRIQEWELNQTLLPLRSFAVTLPESLQPMNCPGVWPLVFIRLWRGRLGCV